MGRRLGDDEGQVDENHLEHDHATELASSGTSISDLHHPPPPTSELGSSGDSTTVGILTAHQCRIPVREVQTGYWEIRDQESTGREVYYTARVQDPLPSRVSGTSPPPTPPPPKPDRTHRKRRSDRGTKITMNTKKAWTVVVNQSNEHEIGMPDVEIDLWCGDFRSATSERDTTRAEPYTHNANTSPSPRDLKIHALDDLERTTVSTSSESAEQQNTENKHRARPM
jgi:hypothetical protein